MPNFVFKYFDVKNVFKIFDSGYERSYRAGGVVICNASNDIDILLAGLAISPLSIFEQTT